MIQQDHPIHRKKRKWYSRKETALLTWNNLFRRDPITARDGPIVSMTTHGRRIRSAYVAIESIARGKRRPSRIVLWMDEGEKALPLPRSILRLKRRGLEVRFSTRRGPHNKYYAHLAETEEFTRALVTADDDVIYPAWWLQVLIDAHETSPERIHCFRAHRFTLNDRIPAPYSTWPECTSTTPSPLNFATGVSGVIYPMRFQVELKAAGDAFMACTPRADDVWLHAMAVRGGWTIQQIRRRAIHFEEVRANRHAALHEENVREGGNDEQIRKTYGEDDLRKLISARSEEAS